MALFDELKELGVNIDEGLQRLGGNEALYTKLLGTFTKNMETHYMDTSFDSIDYGAEIEKAHSIKGTSGNLSLTPIYEAYTDIVALLRAGNPEQAREVLGKILPVQEEIIQCIKKYQG